MNRAFLLNLDFEDELVAEYLGHSYQVKPAMAQRNLSMEWICLALAKPGDKILRRRSAPPSPAPKLPELGPTPTIVNALASDDKLYPWGCSPSVTSLDGTQTWPSSAAVANAHSKAFAADLATSLGAAIPGTQVLRNVEDLNGFLASPTANNRWIAKRAWSVAGRGALRKSGAALSKSDEGWFKKALRFGPVVVQEWLSRRFDCSAVCELTQDGHYSLLGITAMVTRGTTYVGTVLGDVDQVLDLPSGWRGALDSTAEQVGLSLHETGYFGPYGIDAFVSEDGLLYPLIEINARLTMGRVALELARKRPCHKRYQIMARIKTPPPNALSLSSDTVWVDTDDDPWTSF
ncbi:MAG: hypothetical protein P1V97_29570 [Planctomycetota bacterium]|nr:hypothetical protein [Planctomycetota bacterium]